MITDKYSELFGDSPALPFGTNYSMQKRESLYLSSHSHNANQAGETDASLCLNISQILRFAANNILFHFVSDQILMIASVVE